MSQTPQTRRYWFVDFAEAEEMTLPPGENSLPGVDAPTVEALFRSHYARITAMLARLTGDRGHAEEIAADVFHKLSRRPELLRDRADITPWIYRVATNAGLDALRVNSRRRKREDASAGPHVTHSNALESILREERCERVRTVLEKLKPREAQLLLLRSDGLAYRELAESLGIHQASVGTTLARAEAEFERRYRALYGEEV
jgi:RNA polymerase sigma-70 factor (ECF subfamily)